MYSVKADGAVLGKQFDRLSEAYAAGRSGYSDKIYDVLTNRARESFPDLSRRELSLLDVGTGTGIALREIRSKGFSNIIGSDSSLNQIVQAQKADPKHVSDYLVASTEALPFADKSFEVVTAFAAYHWFCNEESIKGISRVLKDGGFFFVVSRVHVPDDLRDGVDQIVRDLGIPFEHPRETYDPAAALRNFGFRVVEEDTASSREYSSVEKVMAWIKSRSVWGLVQGTDKEEIATRRVEELVKGLFEKSGAGTYSLSSDRRCIIAYKST